jgi:hypothetical protein
MMHAASLLLLSLAASEKVQLIIDTDLGNDVDDAGAIAIANQLADAGHVDILGVVCSTGWPTCIAGAQIVNKYYDRPNIPLGAFKGKFGTEQHYQDTYISSLIRDFPHDIKDYNDPRVKEAVQFYIDTLQQANDSSVVIASIGFPINIRDLLRTNSALVAQKVKAVYYMNGGYNFACSGNWIGPAYECHGSAKEVLEKMPKSVKQVFNPNGGSVCTGGRFNSGCGEKINPVKEGYQILTHHGCRPSWDPITVYTAIMGDDSLSTSVDAGTDHIDCDDCAEHWNQGENGSNQFWMSIHDKGAAKDKLDDLLCTPPARHPSPPAPPSPPLPPAPSPPSQYYPDIDGMTAVDTVAEEGAEPARTDYGGGDYQAAWDGNVQSFYDYSQSDGGYTQGRLATPAIVAHIEFYPRSGFLGRYLGGRFMGITTDGKHVELARISAAPQDGWNGLDVKAVGDDIKPLRSVKFESPSGGFGNIAEIKLYQNSGAQSILV